MDKLVLKENGTPDTLTGIVLPLSEQYILELDIHELDDVSAIFLDPDQVVELRDHLNTYLEGVTK